ncbi:antitoxin Xre-like helix-turn-helix domain-containing protein [Neptunomonas sp.]|uniref:antitoxin Xre-like helix-turn-helix domain-containing protein n=1 Tax=Neptunomonas sp. TaxID=1971898 RepID=UPI0025D27381|nr:antitoxin Xre-like helix-turn-helix domain-containing protein [Neptunomonas sp.]
MLNLQSSAPDKAMAATGLKAAVTIMEKWGASGEQGEAILRVSHSTYARAKKKAQMQEVNLDRDQITRISFILNIHAALRLIFDNPDNLYGFMSMINHNPFFAGRSPLQVMGNGDFVAVYETFRRIDSMRGSQW